MRVCGALTGRRGRADAVSLGAGQLRAGARARQLAARPAPQRAARAAEAAAQVRAHAAVLARRRLALVDVVLASGGEAIIGRLFFILQFIVHEIHTEKRKKK